MTGDLPGLVEQARRIVFFGGAGVSTESGIPDFRSAEGIYSTALGGLASPETVLSAAFFHQYPEEFWDFYRANLLHPLAQPNAAHRALAALEATGRLRGVVTQNIDGLHQAAGSRNVVELHGSVHSNSCLKCGAHYDLAWVLAALAAGATVPQCPTTRRRRGATGICGGIIKPDVVLYGEPLDPARIEAALGLIAAADLLIIGGTSLVVQPAASLVQVCRGKIVVINRDASPADAAATLVVREPIAEVFASLRIPDSP